MTASSPGDAQTLAQIRARLHGFILDHRGADRCRMFAPEDTCNCLLCDMDRLVDQIVSLTDARDRLQHSLDIETNSRKELQAKVEQRSTLKAQIAALPRVLAVQMGVPVIRLRDVLALLTDPPREKIGPNTAGGRNPSGWDEA